MSLRISGESRIAASSKAAAVGTVFVAKEPNLLVQPPGRFQQRGSTFSEHHR